MCSVKNNVEVCQKTWKLVQSFEDVTRRCEPSDIVAFLSHPVCWIYFANKKLEGAQRVHISAKYTIML